MIFFLYLQQVFFIVLSALLVSTSTMHSLFYLIILFVGTAVFLLMNGTEFLALVYLIIYTGAIAVFFLFVIMLINLRREDAGLTRAPFVVRLQAILSIHSGLGIALICFINS